MPETTRIRVGEEYFYIDSPEDFLALVEQKLGWDAHDCLEDMLNVSPNNCTGECDYTYEIQEEFERDIDNAIDYLEEIKCKDDKSKEKLKRAISILQTAGK